MDVLPTLLVTRADSFNPHRNNRQRVAPKSMVRIRVLSSANNVTAFDVSPDFAPQLTAVLSIVAVATALLCTACVLCRQRRLRRRQAAYKIPSETQWLPFAASPAVASSATGLAVWALLVADGSSAVLEMRLDGGTVESAELCPSLYPLFVVAGCAAVFFALGCACVPGTDVLHGSFARSSESGDNSCGTEGDAEGDGDANSTEGVAGRSHASGLMQMMRDMSGSSGGDDESCSIDGEVHSPLCSAAASTVGRLDNAETGAHLFLAKAEVDEDTEGSEGLPTRASTSDSYMSSGGAPKVQRAVVFTDIKGGAMLWSELPAAMPAAVAAYTALVRQLAAEHNGTEVKQLGDSFMLVFDEQLPAVRFGLDLTEQAVKCEWPEAILAHASCKEIRAADETVVFRGPRLRIGISYGLVRRDAHAGGSLDFYGKAVQHAATLEARGAAGAVTIASDVAGDVAAALAGMDTVVLPSAAYHVLLPRALCGRQEAVEDEMAACGLDVAEGRGDMLRVNSTFTLSSRAHSLVSEVSEASASTSAQLSPSSVSGTRRRGPRAAGRAGAGSAPELKGTLTRLSGLSVGRIELWAHEVHGAAAAGPADRMGHALDAVVQALHSTSGQIIAVLGAGIAVWWPERGASAGCADMPALFPGLIRATLRQGSTGVSSHVGIALGTCLYGTVGPKRLALIGAPVVLSGLLAQTAIEIDVVGLVCCKTRPPWCPALRPIDTWATLDDGRNYVVYETAAHAGGPHPLPATDVVASLFCPVSPSNTQGSRKPSDATVPAGWSAVYHAAYEKGDSAAVKDLATEDGDRILMLVASLLENRSHLRPPLHPKLLSSNW